MNPMDNKKDFARERGFLSAGALGANSKKLVNLVATGRLQTVLMLGGQPFYWPKEVQAALGQPVVPALPPVPSVGAAPAGLQKVFEWAAANNLNSSTASAWCYKGAIKSAWQSVPKGPWYAAPAELAAHAKKTEAIRLAIQQGGIGAAHAARVAAVTPTKPPVSVLSPAAKADKAAMEKLRSERHKLISGHAVARLYQRQGITSPVGWQLAQCNTEINIELIKRFNKKSAELSWSELLDQITLLKTTVSGTSFLT